MLFGRPLRDATSRSGSASPDDRNADRTRDEWTTALTRYGSRAGDIWFLVLDSETVCDCILQPESQDTIFSAQFLEQGVLHRRTMTPGGNWFDRSRRQS